MKTGILLCNLGTPAAPTAGAIRSWLREFLSDPRVVEIPRVVWLPILYGVILPLRPLKLVHAYQSIWTEKGSPLLAIGREQQNGLAALINAPVALAMRYGEPSIEQGIAELEAQGVTRIVVLPLYPQYSATTTATVFDAVFDVLKQRRAQPAVSTIASYQDDAAYIAALADSVRAHWQRQGRGDHLLLSYHGLPKLCVTRGDPYQRHCEQTTKLLAAALQLRDDEWTLSYQSRVGRAEWLQPYTEQVVTQLAQRGVKKLDAICPGFPADCLETLEEVAQRYDELFAAGGGEKLRYVSALNATPAHLQALAGLLERASFRRF